LQKLSMPTTHLMIPQTSQETDVLLLLSLSQNSSSPTYPWN
jgi:hypothetical protein